MTQIKMQAMFDAIGELFSDETSIAVSNTETYIYYRASKRIDLKIKEGDPVKEGTITHKALTGKQKISEFIDRDLFGVPYYGMAVPLIQEGRLEGCVSAIFPTLTTGKSVVTVKYQEGWVPVPFPKVMYLEASDRKTHVITEKLTGTHKYTLNEFDFLLPKDYFVRCHRSFIVNVNYIKEIYPDTHSTLVLIMKNETKITVSQSYASYFRKLLGF
ncbi:LytTR family transcriptional regulator DNA-binding domain-containing protein [Paenibacillus alginolyticus]|uniref:LytTR family transcriptional regulator DNA-binding domain-containing protein n=1 Tax=Paenibacillus alginolyticus TaxID=59839 RepID=A0ABT4GA37_9BACL|nr:MULTISPECIES: LytTR family DNA-binding domain-containing protein [Paenibacillus]MCY9669157.1 LytTR family transcriptional regulator DNA-binding domain-containing protein [Paenibacillus alginolyticus]MCY9693051.1 LytTR family transcriptional regulator DNA-binding domain-containing protein [Paenibacillus alginolyticus]MEC0147137.1 LytTR family DNA-binding domain-containing protein [Paenibacillus alginolyticus]NRF90124.1 LytTR family transcriptional regulator DNA-binding domain-containing prote